MKNITAENISFTEKTDIHKRAGCTGYKGTKHDRLFFAAAVIIMFMISAASGL